MADPFQTDADNAKVDMNTAMDLASRDLSAGIRSTYPMTPALKDRQGRNVLDHTTTHRPPVIGPSGYD